MSFVVDGNYIKQTGDDTSFAGMEGLDGVTVQQFSYTKIYTTNRQLNLTGNWQINPKLERIIMDYQSSSSKSSYFYGTGRIVGGAQDRNVAFFCTDSGSPTHYNSRFSFLFRGTITGSSLIVSCTKSIGFSSSCSLIFSNNLIFLRDTTKNGGGGQVKLNNCNLTCDKFIINGFHIYGAVPTTTNIKSLVQEEGGGVYTRYNSSAVLNKYYNYTNYSVSNPFWMGFRQKLEIINEKSNYSSKGTYGSNRDGLVQKRREIDLNFKYQFSTITKTKFIAFYHNQSSNVDYTGDGDTRAGLVPKYTELTNVTGETGSANDKLTTSYIYAYFLSNDNVVPPKRYFLTKNKGTSEIFYFCNYACKLFSKTVEFLGINTLSEDIFLKQDISIREFDISIVSSYILLETVQKLYDFAKYEIYNNFTGETETTVTLNGIDLNLRSLNFIIDKNAVQVFSLSSGTLTIKADKFVGNVTTTGTISFLNGSSIQGSYSDAGGVTSSLIFSNLVNTSIYLTDSSNNLVSFEANVTAVTKILSIKGIASAHKIILSRAGYKKLSFNFKADGSFSEETPAYTKLLDVDASAMFKNITSTNVTFSLFFGKITANLTGNITAPFFFDTLEKFLGTQDGCKWLLDNNLNQPQRLNLDFAGQFLNLPLNLNVSGSSYKIGAFIGTSETPFDVTLGGSVIYNLSSSVILDIIQTRLSRLQNQIFLNFRKNVTIEDRLFENVTISEQSFTDNTNLTLTKGTVSNEELQFAQNEIEFNLNVPDVYIDKIILSELILTESATGLSIEIFVTSNNSESSVEKFDGTESKGWGIVKSEESPFNGFILCANPYLVLGVSKFTNIRILITVTSHSSGAKLKIGSFSLLRNEHHLKSNLRPYKVDLTSVKGIPVTNIGDFKATKTDANIVEVRGTSVTSIGDFKSSIATVDLTSLNPKFLEIKEETDKIAAVKSETDKLSFDSDGFVKSDLQKLKGKDFSSIDDFKATKTDANVVEVKTVAVTNIDDFKSSTATVDLTSLNPKFLEIKEETDKIAAVKSETDKLSFDSDGFVKSDLQKLKGKDFSSIDDFKATKTDANVVEVRGTSVTSIGDFKATKTDVNVVEVKGKTVDSVADFKNTVTGSGGFIKRRKE